MTSNDLIRASRLLALILRHKPDAIGITLDDKGWARVPELLKGMKAAGHSLSRTELADLVAADDKGRYVLSPDGGRIRAAQGHSLKVDLGLKPMMPPALLFHGTAPKALASIRKTGLEKRKRAHVHLSPDIQTAIKVGARRGEPVILTILAGNMHAAGHLLYRSENGVWLTDHVPTSFIDWSATLFNADKR